MKKLITITTDFKDQFATAQLKAVIASLGFEGKLIENHDVKAYSIVEGAYGIWQISKFCPSETVHVGVIDPGVGSGRAGIVIKTKNFWFVGPDNGLLYPAANRDGILKIWRIDESAFGKIANTFHGRDVFIKAAVYLSQGKAPEEFGCKLLKYSDVKPLEFKNGQVLHIDSYGNIKLFWKNKIKIHQRLFGVPLVKTFSDVSKNSPLILNGSSNLLELAINLGNANKKYKLQPGDILSNLEV